MGFDFDGFYNEKVKPIEAELDEVRRKRKKDKKTTQTMLVVLVGMFVIAFIGSLTEIVPDWINAFLFTTIVPFAIFYIIISSVVNKKSKAALKEKVNRILMENMFPSLIYHYQVSSMQLVNKTKLFGSIDRVHCDDVISGQYPDGTYFDIHDTKFTRIRRDNDGKTSTRTLFNGMILSVQLPRNTYGYIQAVEKYNSEGKLTRWLMEKISKLEVIHIEDEVFNEYFTTTGSNDQVKRILTPELRAYLVQIKEKYPEIAFSFSDGFAIVAIPSKKDLFDISLDEELSRETFMKLYEEIKEALEMTEEIYHRVGK